MHAARSRSTVLGLRHCREYLDPTVSGVGDVHLAAGVDGDATRVVELTVRRPGRSPGSDEVPTHVEHADAVVVGLGDVHEVSVDGDTARNVELAGTGPGAAPDGSDQVPVRVVLEDLALVGGG